jgi:hypothetical protein
MAVTPQLYFSKSRGGLEKDGELAYINAHWFVAGIIVSSSRLFSS